MKRINIFTLTLSLILLWAMPSPATIVTGIVTDPSGAVYSSGTFNIDFMAAPTCGQLPTFQTQFSGSLDGGGNLPALNIADNNSICSGSQWKFSICNVTRTTCFNTSLTITGPAQVITTALKTAAVLLPGSQPVTLSTAGTTGIAVQDQYGTNQAAGQAYSVPVRLISVGPPPLNGAQQSNALLFRDSMKSYCYQNLNGCAPASGGLGQ